MGLWTPQQEAWKASIVIPRLAHYEREEFVRQVWPEVYAPGEHVVFSEPTGQGKTHLAGQLLEVTLEEHPELAFTSLMPKPADPATRRLAERMNLQVTSDWPAPDRIPLIGKRYRGEVLWPRHLKSATVAENRDHLAAIFRRGLRDRYWRGHCIVFADDVYVLSGLLGLNDVLEEYWTAGQSMGAGLWSGHQKPSGTRQGSVSTFAYNAAAHLLFGHDPDRRNVERMRDIAGVNPEIAGKVIESLPVVPVMTAAGLKNLSHKLYVSKRGYMCTVGI